MPAAPEIGFIIGATSPPISPLGPDHRLREALMVCSVSEVVVSVPDPGFLLHLVLGHQIEQGFVAARAHPPLRPVGPNPN